MNIRPFILLIFLVAYAFLRDAEHRDRFEKMKTEALAVLASVDASAWGKDYPEGRVIQPPRHDKWFEMDAYKCHLDTFARLKPGFRVKD